jgi:hypothetical protein
MLQVNPSQSNLPLELSVIAICISCVSAVAAIGRWLATYKQINVQNLLQVSQFLHQAEFRNARNAVRSCPKEQLDPDQVRRVCSSFDLAALFVRNKLIEKRIMLQYWGSLLIFLSKHFSDFSDKILFAQVAYRDYYQHFYWLMSEAQKDPEITRLLD